jgi:hypothetical protein
MLLWNARRAGRYFKIQQLMPRCFAVVACYLLHFAKVPTYETRGALSPEPRWWFGVPPRRPRPSPS